MSLFLTKGERAGERARSSIEIGRSEGDMTRSVPVASAAEVDLPYDTARVRSFRLTIPRIPGKMFIGSVD
jgi:hypothetical protein